MSLLPTFLSLPNFNGLRLEQCLSVAVIGSANGERWWAIVLGGLLAIVAVSLLIASWTKWGQTKSLTKCIALAFLAHIWLLVYAYGTRIVTPGAGGGSGGGPASPGYVSVLFNNAGEFTQTPPSSVLAVQESKDGSADSQRSNESADQDDSTEGADKVASSSEAPDNASSEAEDQSDSRGKTRTSLNEWEKPLASEQNSLLVPLADIPIPELETMASAGDAESLSNVSTDFETAQLPQNPAFNLADFGAPDLTSLAEVEALLQTPAPPPPHPAVSPNPLGIAEHSPIFPPAAPANPLVQPNQSDQFLPPQHLTALSANPMAGISQAAPSWQTPRVSPSANHSSAPAAVARSLNASTYQNRFAQNRMDIVRAGGGDENTEAAVELALEWLARAQSPNGGWNAAAYGAGNPIMLNRAGPDGERRQNAGVKANTAMTGLALLAFLGAGHHHQDGPYATTVHNALQYLLSEQLPSGDMSGRDQVGRDDSVRFARMYSHGMAAFAVAEAYAITGDQQLLPAIRAASRYSLAAMNPRTGGWRYEYPTDDPGDTSQFGWQAMFLHSASNANASPLSHDNRSRMERFLNSVATGRSGGLAAYRPSRNGVTIDQATPSMTAEALASKLLLSLPVHPESAIEAQQYLLRSLPGKEQDNFYYWYYATLALYQLKAVSHATTSGPYHAEGWNQWNNALKARLCSSQITAGPNRGSWNPTCVWGQYGGRVYTTALGALSLEVYYRYLPILQTNMANTAWANQEAPIR